MSSHRDRDSDTAMTASVSPHQTRKILCVCTGNSCRSVMAQGLLRTYLKGRTDLQILSAGLGTMGGMGPTPETVEVMARESIDIASHVSQPVTPDLVRKADLILVMDRMHREVLIRRHPEAASKTFLLREFDAPGPVEDPDIPDPIGQPLGVYERCLETIKEGVVRVVAWLAQAL